MDITKHPNNSGKPKAKNVKTILAEELQGLKAGEAKLETTGSQLAETVKRIADVRKKAAGQ